MCGAKDTGSERGNSPCPMKLTVWWERHCKSVIASVYLAEYMKIEGWGCGDRNQGPLKNSYCFFGKFISLEIKWGKKCKYGKVIWISRELYQNTNLCFVFNSMHMSATTSFHKLRCMWDVGCNGEYIVFGADSDLPNFIRLRLCLRAKKREVYCKHCKIKCMWFSVSDEK